MSSLNYEGNTSYNLYRTGVLIRNQVEDMYGLDLKVIYKRSQSYNLKSPKFNEDQKNNI